MNEETWYVVELSCMSCSRDCGEVRIERPDQPIFRAPCVCGGMPVVRDIQQHNRYRHDTILFEKPRVGRPPKRHTNASAEMQ